jgi:hypothetical protein
VLLLLLNATQTDSGYIEGPGLIARLLVGTPMTVGVVFFDTGIAADPGTVTVTLTRADGTVLAVGAPTAGTGSGPRSYRLSTVAAGSLDTLTATWSSATLGTITTTIEIVGGFLFSLPEVRALTPLDDTTKYTNADVLTVRTQVEEAIEQEAGCAFVPRYTLETFDGTGTNTLLLSKPVVRRLRSVSVNAALYGSTDLAVLATKAAGTVYAPAGWPSGYSNVTIGYEHGYGTPPAEIRRAALMLAKMWLTARRSPLDDRAVTFSAADGGSYSLAVPGRNGSYFGHPDVDSVIDRYKFVLGVA